MDIYFNFFAILILCTALVSIPILIVVAYMEARGLDKIKPRLAFLIFASYLIHSAFWVGLFLLKSKQWQSLNVTYFLTYSTLANLMFYVPGFIIACSKKESAWVFFILAELAFLAVIML